MKKIVPFNNVLSFNTDVCEITAISLEHDITKTNDEVSGKFYISGEYKMTDGQLTKEKFNFDLPFDIALGCSYDLNTLEIDIDDFRYELIDNNKLKINIDLSIEGEELKPDEPLFTDEELREMSEANEDIIPESIPIQENIELLDDITDNKEVNNNINIFNNLNTEEKYVTYHVYPVTENDTLDKILEKYHITKEELNKYNDNLDIKKGDKLIIPANNNDK